MELHFFFNFEIVVSAIGVRVTFNSEESMNKSFVEYLQFSVMTEKCEY